MYKIQCRHSLNRNLIKIFLLRGGDDAAAASIDVAVLILAVPLNPWTRAHPCEVLSECIIAR